MTTNFHKTIAESATGLFTTLFLYTGVSKLSDYALFKGQIATSPLLAPIAPYAAAIIPWLEFFVALLLIIPRTRLKGLYSTSILMISFTTYIIGVITLDKNLPCGCGGAIEQFTWTQHLIFNFVLIALSIVAIRSEKRLREERKIAISKISSRYAI